MTTVYLVSSGIYSDYSVHGIYSTRKRAEARSRLVRDANEVQEFILDEGIEAVNQGLNSWLVHFYEDGSTSPFQSDWEFSNSITGRVKDLRKTKQHGQPRAEFTVYVMARDEAHALKIAQDKRAEYLAKEAGVTE